MAKKLNKKYLYATMKSKKFRDASVEYIQKHLLDHQKKEITKKMFVLVHKWYIDTRDRIFQNFKALCEYIETHPKFKLPWTIIEAKEASERFCSWFDVYNLYV